MQFAAHGLSNELSILIDYWRERFYAADLDVIQVHNNTSYNVFDHDQIFIDNSFQFLE